MQKQLPKVFPALLIAAWSITSFAQPRVGAFDGQTSIGNKKAEGLTTYKAENQSYTSTFPGAKGLHFTWKKMRGDFIVQMQISWTNGTNTNRETGWMVRESLEPASPFVSAGLQGEASASLKYSQTDNSEARITKIPIKNIDVIQLERKGETLIMSVAKFGEPFTHIDLTGVHLANDVYVGTYLSSENNGEAKKAVFKNVRFITPAGKDLVPYKDYLGSHLEILDVFTGHREIVHTSSKSLQAPNYTADGNNLIYNSDGLIYKFDLQTKTEKAINTDFVTKNNNDHVLSMDGKYLGLSSSSADPKLGSIIYTVPVEGGKPVQITPHGPSYLHGWSPDNKYLVYTGQRNGEFDIYRIPSKGGVEERLTTTPGLDDGSEYSPDGKFIYYNSVRSGTMQIWRMRPDGTAHEQLTSDEYNNWFPHISPDGKWIAFLSFMKDVPPSDHPFYKPVYIRLMPVTGGEPKVIAYVYGGQGTMNTPNWSPDSQKLAFISNTDLKLEENSNAGN